MKYLGAHVSAAGGPAQAVLRAVEIGADAFALFIKNQRQWHAKPLTDETIEAFPTLMRDPRIDEKPMVLETVKPVSCAEEITWLRAQVPATLPWREPLIVPIVAECWTAR